MTATNPLSSFGSFNYNFGNTPAGQKFFDSYTTRFPTFNSNVKVTPGLPSVSKPQDYSNKGTKLPDNVSVSKSGTVTVKAGDYATDSKGKAYFRGKEISPADVSYGLAQLATALVLTKNEKQFNTDKMTKNQGDIAMPIKGVGGKDQFFADSMRVLSNAGKYVVKDIVNSAKDTVQNPTGGPILRSSFPGRRVGSGTRLEALPTNTKSQVAPATTPTAVAIAKSPNATSGNNSKNDNSKNDNNKTSKNNSSNNKSSGNSTSAASPKPSAQAAPSASAPKAAAPAPATAKAPEPAKPSSNNKNDNKNDSKNDNKNNNKKK